MDEFRFGRPDDFIDRKVVESAIFEIRTVANKYVKRSAKKMAVLDVGSGHGEYASALARYFGRVVGVEPSFGAYDLAVKKMMKGRKNLDFVHSKIEDYKSKIEFDLAVHLTVFEHMSDQKKGFDRIFFLLKKNGVIFLTAPNKYWVFEQHYGLPFLAWLPLPLANFYLRLTKGVGSYEDCSYSKGYAGMKSFFDQYNCDYEFVLPQDTNGAYVGCGNNRSIFNMIKRLGLKLIRMDPFFWNFSKGFMMVIRKK